VTIDLYCVCGKHLLAPESAAGKRGRCPTCGRIIIVAKPEPPPEEAEPVAPEEPPKEEAPRATCLIADTDKEYLKALQSMFEQHGYQVIHTTGDGTDAMEKARELKPRVIVLDVKLRPISGFQIVEHLTDPANPKNQGVWRSVFVMIAPKVLGREKQYALSLGVEIYVQKPFTPVQVFPRIERRLQKKAM